MNGRTHVQPNKISIKTNMGIKTTNGRQVRSINTKHELGGATAGRRKTSINGININKHGLGMTVNRIPEHILVS